MTRISLDVYHLYAYATTMIKRLSFLLISLSTLGLNACAYSNALESYNSKSCEEIRKVAQEQFLGRAPLSKPDSRDDDNAREILNVLFQEDERIEKQAKKNSYKRRCR